MLVELRGLKKTNGEVGLQTVLPGSVHVSGEPITFEAGHDSVPATVAPADLVRAVHKVAAPEPEHLVLHGSRNIASLTMSAVSSTF
jgi:hypothetical protein